MHRTIRAALAHLLPPEQRAAALAAIKPPPKKLYEVFAQSDELTMRFNISAESATDATGEALGLCPWAGIVQVKPVRVV
jgi:hypothetical protein